MAKAREIPGLTTELPYGEVASRVLEVRVAELIEHSAGVLDTDDIERVHAMRVATRRLRAAIEIFHPCFPKADGKRALRAVKALADALGERRDRDVAVDSLDAFAAAMPAPDRPGIHSLAARYRREQAAANVALEPFVDPARLQEIREAVRGLAAAARQAGGAGAEPAGEEPAAAEPEAEQPAAVEPQANQPAAVAVAAEQPVAAGQPAAPAADLPADRGANGAGPEREEA